MRHFRPKRCRGVCCLPVFITATKQSNTFTNMDACVDVDGLAHQELCSLLSGPHINASVMLQDQPHGSVRAQAGRWTLALQSGVAVNIVAVWFSITRGLNFFAATHERYRTERTVQLVNCGGSFGFGIKGCINNSEQKHHGCDWPRPLHHSCPLHDYKLASSVL